MAMNLMDLIRKPKVLIRTAEVGWILDTDNAGFIWDGPRKLTTDHPPATHAKSASFCPAILDHESRI